MFPFANNAAERSKAAFETKVKEVLLRKEIIALLQNGLSGDELPEYSALINMPINQYIGLLQSLETKLREPGAFRSLVTEIEALEISSQQGVRITDVTLLTDMRESASESINLLASTITRNVGAKVSYLELALMIGDFDTAEKIVKATRETVAEFQEITEDVGSKAIALVISNTNDHNFTQLNRLAKSIQTKYHVKILSPEETFAAWTEMSDAVVKMCHDILSGNLVPNNASYYPGSNQKINKILGLLRRSARDTRRVAEIYRLLTEVNVQPHQNESSHYALSTYVYEVSAHHPPRENIKRAGRKIVFLGTGSMPLMLDHDFGMRPDGDLLVRMAIQDAIYKGEKVDIVRGVSTHYMTYEYILEAMLDDTVPTAGGAISTARGTNIQSRLKIELEDIVFPDMLKIFSEQMDNGLHSLRYELDIVGHSRGAITSYYMVTLCHNFFEALKAKNFTAAHIQGLRQKYKRQLGVSFPYENVISAIKQRGSLVQTLMAYDPVEGATAVQDAGWNADMSVKLDIPGFASINTGLVLPESLKKAVIPVAAQEPRQDFRPSIAQVNNQTSLKIIEIPGTHSNVHGNHGQTKGDDAGKGIAKLYFNHPSIPGDQRVYAENVMHAIVDKIYIEAVFHDRKNPTDLIPVDTLMLERILLGYQSRSGSYQFIPSAYPNAQRYLQQVLRDAGFVIRRNTDFYTLNDDGRLAVEQILKHLNTNPDTLAHLYALLRQDVHTLLSPSVTEQPQKYNTLRIIQGIMKSDTSFILDIDIQSRLGEELKERWTKFYLPKDPQNQPRRIWIRGKGARQRFQISEPNKAFIGIDNLLPFHYSESSAPFLKSDQRNQHTGVDAAYGSHYDPFYNIFYTAEKLVESNNASMYKINALYQDACEAALRTVQSAMWSANPASPKNNLGLAGTASPENLLLALFSAEGGDPLPGDELIQFCLNETNLPLSERKQVLDQFIAKVMNDYMIDDPNNLIPERFSAAIMQQSRASDNNEEHIWSYYTAKYISDILSSAFVKANTYNPAVYDGLSARTLESLQHFGFIKRIDTGAGVGADYSDYGVIEGIVELTGKLISPAQIAYLYETAADSDIELLNRILSCDWLDVNCLSAYVVASSLNLKRAQQRMRTENNEMTSHYANLSGADPKNILSDIYAGESFDDIYTKYQPTAVTSVERNTEADDNSPANVSASESEAGVSVENAEPSPIEKAHNKLIDIANIYKAMKSAGEIRNSGAVLQRSAASQISDLKLRIYEVLIHLEPNDAKTVAKWILEGNESYKRLSRNWKNENPQVKLVSLLSHHTNSATWYLKHAKSYTLITSIANAKTDKDLDASMADLKREAQWKDTKFSLNGGRPGNKTNRQARA